MLNPFPLTRNDRRYLANRRLRPTWRALAVCQRCGVVLVPGLGIHYGRLRGCLWCVAAENGWEAPSVHRIAEILSVDYPRLDVATDLDAIDWPRMVDDIVHERQDRAWLCQLLGHVAKALHPGLLAGYRDTYEETFAHEPNANRKEGQARFMANTRLRQQLEAIGIHLTGTLNAKVGSN